MGGRSEGENYILLGPAGSFEMGAAVLDAGADAVFAGLRGFSRRGFTYELSVEEVAKLCQYAGARGKTVRLAVNSYPDDRYQDRLLQDMGSCISAGVNSVILNDAGLCTLVRDRYPETGIHASVGASVFNSEDALFWRDCGATGLVLLCNLRPEDVRSIALQVPLELEILVHANRDFAFLGKCWISSYASVKPIVEGNYTKVEGSPNRGGVCYRVCRRVWQMTDERRALGGATDLPNECRFMVHELAAYANAGVTCFKIQGREYSPKLVKKMVHLYRRLLDRLGRKFDDENVGQTVAEIESLRNVERSHRTSDLVQTALEQRGGFHASSTLQ